MKYSLNIAVTMLSCSGLFLNESFAANTKSLNHPNVILIMADDLGYGDVGFNGNTVVKTPTLDSMATHGIRFSRFYSSAPTSSPTRASCLTGRNAYRVNIPFAGDGGMPSEEITIAEALKTAGYQTGHFGKWHVGGLSRTIKQSYFKGDVTPYSPPWYNGFDQCMSTESMMPTYNPYYWVGPDYESKDYRVIQTERLKKGQRTGGFHWRDYYWTGDGQFVDQWLEGDDSKIVMDRSLQFIEKCKKEETPFLSLIWFHTPHTPVASGPEMNDLYPDQDMQGKHWFGALTAMDVQIGRLHRELKKMGLDENTIIWFCSDNGPSYTHDYNSSGPFRGKKSELYEGGIHVPGIISYPKKWKTAKVVDAPSSTSDIYPTILSLCGVEVIHQTPLDGIDITPLLKGKKERKEPIAFMAPLTKRLKKDEPDPTQKQYAVVGDQYKLISVDNGESWQLYDLTKDLKETTDVSQKHKRVFDQYKSYLDQWLISVKNSSEGKDYTH